MENKNEKTQFKIQFVFVIIFFLALCFPLAMMAFSGPDDYDQEVFQETETNIVELNFSTYADGTFHKSFEKWFSRYYPLRSDIVTLYNWLRLEFENLRAASLTMTALNSIGSVYRPFGAINNIGIGEKLSAEDRALYLNPQNKYADMNGKQFEIIPEEPAGFKGNAVVRVGKSGYLFDSAYIDEYYGLSELYTNVSQEGIQQTVDKLEYIQNELKKRYGITMLFVISPSKASYCTEYIPDYYVNRFTPAQNYVRPVDILRQKLSESKINFLDSNAYYREIGLLSVFPKTGVHWNHVASFETTSKLISMYSEISGEVLKQPKADGVRSSPYPIQTGNSDADLYNLLYGASGSASDDTMDSEYYSPLVKVENEDAKKIKAFVQGGSFTSDIAYYLEAYNVADVDRIHYNGTFVVDHWEDGADPWKDGIYAWEKILQNYDLFVFEQNEQYVRGGHITDGNWEAQSMPQIGSNAIYDSLYEYLRATE